MTGPASVDGGERLRLFVGFPLPAAAAAAIGRWQGRLPSTMGRLVPEENLHLTVAFLGHRPAGEVPAVVEVLREAASAARSIALSPRRYRETRSVGMLVFDDPQDAATRVAERVQKRLERLGVYRREARPWLPHVTVVRFRERPRLAPDVPQFGPVSPSDLALYHSALRSTGAQYEIVESVALGG